MQKSDLRTGMRVELANGRRFVVLENMEIGCYGVQRFVFARNGGVQTSSAYNEDLTDISDSEFTVVKVYDRPKSDALLKEDCAGTLLWTRKEPKKMTLAEIENKLGYPIKIIE